MSKKFKVIGEGTYGCVVKPSLKCDSDQDYTNKVSKIMVEEDALSELKENNNISNIKDLKKYAIVNPEICKPKIDKTFINTAKTCKNERITIRLNNSNYQKTLSMLLLEDGGEDLSLIIKKIDSLSEDDIKNFFYSFINLFEGLKFFREKKIIHRDIKLQNIVYNKTSKLSKFIDFGLSIKSDKLKKNADKSRERLAVSWSYFPPENSCVNKKMFTDLTKCEKYSKNMSYDSFINKYLETYDIYCLSLALNSLFKYIEQKPNLLSINYKQLILKVRKLLKYYCDIELIKRYSDLNYLISEYTNLLNFYFNNNNNNNNSNNNSNNNNIKKCPDEKPILNTKTLRCLKKCKDGYIHNEQFKCVSNKTSKNNKKKQVCESLNKDYNPYTKRCNKKCPPNKVRSNDKTFKCIKKI
jgi:serine/threonine protein kinase